MRRIKVVVFLVIGISFLHSCSNSDFQHKEDAELIANKVLQQTDGSIALLVEKADCYCDMVNPATNTAEWNVVVSKSGRFNVWLSSATVDTTKLEYRSKVLLSVHDSRLEAQPGIDKVFTNSSDVNYPYFRADSFMGSLYIQDTGLFAVQLISDRIISEDEINENTSGGKKTRLLSVFLTPVVR